MEEVQPERDLSQILSTALSHGEYRKHVLFTRTEGGNDLSTVLGEVTRGIEEGGEKKTVIFIEGNPDHPGDFVVTYYVPQ